MKKTSIPTWIIDDHPMIISGIHQALTALSERETLDFEIRSFNSSDEVSSYLQSPQMTRPKIVFLDIVLHSDPNERHRTGEDLGAELRALFPEVLIVVLTTISDAYRIRNIFSSINPQGFFVKSDADFEPLIDAVSEVLNGIPYYSPMVRKILQRSMSNQIPLDPLNRRLLYELSKGTRMVKMHEKLPLSKTAIEKRKRQLKYLFGVEDGGDEELLERARECGFVD